jgi:SPP1 family predicted phage head-tail adaptor
MKAGTLDRRVSILRPAPASDDGYTTVEGWVEVGQRWAAFKPQVGREAIEASGKDGMEAARFHLRHDSLTRTITELDVLEFENRRYAIIAPPIELGRREGVELVVRGEGVV